MALKIIAAIVMGLLCLACLSFGTLFALLAVVEEGNAKAEFKVGAKALWVLSILFCWFLLILVVTST